MSQLIDRRSDDELLALMSNLGGHDMASMIEALEAIDHDRPVCFIAYTIKGVGLPMQGHKDNHAGLMTVAQMEKGAARRTFAPAMNGTSSKVCRRRRPSSKRLAAAPFNQEGRRRLTAPVIEFRNSSPSSRRRRCRPSKALGWCSTNSRAATPNWPRIVTASPDVTVSTNLGAWVNRRGLFAKAENHDLFRQEKIPSTFNWDYSPKGQHLELGIAEMNLFIMLSALGCRMRSMASGCCRSARCTIPSSSAASMR